MQQIFKTSWLIFDAGKNEILSERMIGGFVEICSSLLLFRNSCSTSRFLRFFSLPFFKFPLQTLNFPVQNDRVEMEHRFEICTKIADFIMKRWKEMGSVFLIRSLDQDNCINEMKQTGLKFMQFFFDYNRENVALFE